MANGEPSAADVDLAIELERLRSENAELRMQMTAAPTSKASPGRGRRVSSIVCAVLGAILLPLSVLTVWTQQTILDTDSYVATVAPLADNEDIQAAITFQVTEAVAEAADFRSLAEEALPPNAAVLAGPIEAGAKTLIEEVVARVIATDLFAELWEDVNRIGHDNVVKLIKGDGNKVLETSGGRIVVNLGPFAEEAIKEVDKRLGTDLAETVPAEQLDLEFVIVESDDLADVQDAMSLLNAVSWITVILAIALLAAAVLLADNRRLGFRRVGIAIVAPMIIALVLYAWARGQYNDSLSANVDNPDAATAFFDVTTRFLLRSFRALLVLGLVFLIGAWVMGPSASAAKVRAWWDQLLGRASEAGAERDVGPVPRWVATRERALSIAAVVVGALALVLWTRPTGWVVILLLVGVLLVVGAVRLVAEVGRRADLALEEEFVESEIVDAVVADDLAGSEEPPIG